MRLWARMVDQGVEFLLAGFREWCGSAAAAREACLNRSERRDVEGTAVKIQMLTGRPPRPSDVQRGSVGDDPGWLAGSRTLRNGACGDRWVYARRLPGGMPPVRVVQPNDLIVIDPSAGRIIDPVDAAMVLRENRDAIDVSRLERSVKEIGLAADYERIRQDAFPGEADPRVVG